MADKAHFVHNIVSNIDRARPMKKKGYVHYSRQIPAKTAMKASKLPPEPKKEHEVPKVETQYVDAKIEAAELRMENKLVRLESRLDQLIHSIDEMRRHMLTPGQALAGAFTFFIAIVGAVVAIISYGGDRTDAGYGVGSAVESRVSATEQKFEKLSDDMEEIKTLIKASQQTKAPANETPEN